MRRGKVKKLTAGEQLLVGLTLFSMFFGAGNLIFPPFLGAQAGNATWIAMLGFAVSAIGFPVLGVMAIARAGGLPELAGRVHPVFASAFTLLAYLSIGPCLAIPRTASTSFEMAVTPFAGNTPLWVSALYSLAFFGVALAVALKPDKLSDRLGKITGPCLLILIAVLFVGCLVNAPGGYGAPGGSYQSDQLTQGLLDGYQTMDTLAALNFGIIIVLNVRAKGVEDDKVVFRSTIRAGWIAGGVLLAVYAALAHVGGVSGGAFPGAANGAQVLTGIVGWLFGPLGSVLLALLFVLACLNTCIGLISCCGEYFATRFPVLSYRGWAAVFAAFSFVVSIAGLDAILAFSTPVLQAIYPVAIVLIALGLCHRWLAPYRLVYPAAILCAGVVSVLTVLTHPEALGLSIPLLSGWMSVLPFYKVQLAWLVPAAVGAAAGVVLSRVFPERT